MGRLLENSGGVRADDGRAALFQAADSDRRRMTMRIGVVIAQFDPRRGGAEYWTFRHVKQLLADGHEVHVAALKFGENCDLPIAAHCISAPASPLARAAAAERILRPLNLDVVHDMGFGWFGRVFQSEDGSRAAQWERSLAVLPPPVRPIKRLLMRCLPRYVRQRRLMNRQYSDPQRLIIAISRMCADDYRQRHGVPDERVRLVYHGVETDRYTPDRCAALRPAARRQLQLRDDQLAVLFVGHDYRRKGLATAAAAIERLAARGIDARLLVVGGNHRGQQLPSRPLSAGLLLPVGAQSDPLPYYAAADVFVLPSYYDPFGLVVLEAAACGLPVITTRCTGASELLHDGGEGYLLDDPGDAAALAERLSLLADPQRRLAMGAAARRTAAQYGVERNYRETLAVYREAVERREATLRAA